MHDLVDYETRGIPSVLVASSAFAGAAARQAAALGMPAIAERAVYVPHPIQDATDSDMRDKAAATIDAIVAALVTAPSP